MDYTLGAKELFSTPKIHFPGMEKFQLFELKFFRLPSVFRMEISVPHTSFDHLESKRSHQNGFQKGYFAPSDSVYPMIYVLWG